MNDDVKAANDALVESMVRQLRDCVSVGDEMTLDHACLIDDAADWIAGEPARLAAAREEQREVCAVNLEAAIGRGKGWAVNVRATPLTATPLADEITALRAQLAEATEGVKYWTGIAQNEANQAAAARAQVEAARAFVPALADVGYPEQALALLAAMDEAKPSTR